VIFVMLFEWAGGLPILPHPLLRLNPESSDRLTRLVRIGEPADKHFGNAGTNFGKPGTIVRESKNQRSGSQEPHYREFRNPTLPQTFMRQGLPFP
ncbi:hypothetical protein ABH309_19200, partial [Chromobacterium piscinae]